MDRGIATPIELAGDARTQTARSALRRAVLQRERARGGRRSGEGELWTALVLGRWTLIDRFEENGRRFVLAVRTPQMAAIRALDARERRIIAAVARGESNKAIAIDNSLSEATISRIVRRALASLGVGLAELLAFSRLSAAEVQLSRTRLALVAMPSEHPRLRELTSAERATVECAMRGLATSAISRNRAVSARTIANQLASAYAKLGVRSRRELILTLAGHAPC
ncbi:MAG: hypothetical protein HOV81_14920 [Kofleriaceae bacterium]|nr:hypothetical protein [Kofleriaceae bacterium]